MELDNSTQECEILYNLLVPILCLVLEDFKTLHIRTLARNHMT